MDLISIRRSQVECGVGPGPKKAAITTPYTSAGRYLRCWLLEMHQRVCVCLCVRACVCVCVV